MRIVINSVLIILSFVFLQSCEDKDSKDNYLGQLENRNDILISQLKTEKNTNKKLLEKNTNLASKLKESKNQYKNHYLNYMTNNLFNSTKELNADIWLTFNIDFDNFMVSNVYLNNQEIGFLTRNKKFIFVLPIKMKNLQSATHLKFKGIDKKNNKIQKNYTCNLNTITFSMECRENKKILF